MAPATKGVVLGRDPDDDWVSGYEAMTGAQASYVKTLSEEVGEPDAFAEDLTKAEASKRIDETGGRLESGATASDFVVRRR